jgi:hypothetical protein
LLLLIIAGFLLMPGRKDQTGDYGISPDKRQFSQKSKEHQGRSGSSGASGAFNQEQTANYSKTEAGARRSSFSSSSSSVSGSRGGKSKPLQIRRAYSEEEARRLRQERDRLRKEVYKRKLEWVKDKANDKSLSAKARYRYRLKLLEGYRAGNNAFNQGDYAEAMRQYMNALKDVDGNGETAFIVLTQMRMTAKMLQDYDLYVELMKQQAQLIEKEDLKIFGIGKKDSGWGMYNSRRRYVMAIKESGGVEKAVEEIMAEIQDAGSDRNEIRRRFEEEVAEFKKDFESVRSQIGLEG